MDLLGGNKEGQEIQQMPADPSSASGYIAQGLMLQNTTQNSYAGGSKQSGNGYDGMSPVTRRTINAMQTNFLTMMYGDPMNVSIALDAEDPAYRESREERVLGYLSETGTDSNIGLPPEEVLIESCPKVGEARAPGVNKFYEEWFSKPSAQKPRIPDQILNGTGGSQPFAKFYLEKQKEMLSDGVVEEVAQRVLEKMNA